MKQWLASPFRVFRSINYSLVLILLVLGFLAPFSIGWPFALLGTIAYLELRRT